MDICSPATLSAWYWLRSMSEAALSSSALITSPANLQARNFSEACSGSRIVTGNLYWCMSVLHCTILLPECDRSFQAEALVHLCSRWGQPSME